MVDNGFMFGDQATWDYPICKVEKFPEIPTPKKRFETYVIPGRSGVLHSFEGAFEPIDKKYACYLHADHYVAETVLDIKSWLLAQDGPQRLIDPYDQEHFFRATVDTEIQFENWMNQYARFTVQFTCDPRAFRRTGEEPIEMARPYPVWNPCAYPAQPLITIFGTGTGTLDISGQQIQIKSLDGDMIIDCEDMEAYRLAAGAVIGCNNKISAPEFPALRPGVNQISWSGGIQRVVMIPRWFDI